MTVDNVYYVTDLSTALNAGDYSVFYFDNNNDGIFGDGDPLTTAKQAVDGRPGGVPNEVGKFTIVVVQGKVDTTGFGTDNLDTFSEVKAKFAGHEWHFDNFTIEKAVKDFTELSAYEYDPTASDKGLSDTELTYDGDAITVGVAMGGKALTFGDISKVELLGQPAGIAASDVVYASGTATDNAYLTVNQNVTTKAQAGTYTVRLTGAGDYAGKTAELTFTIGKLDLSKALLSITPVKTGSTINYASADRQVTGISLLADGSKTALDPNDYAAYLTAVNGDKTEVSKLADGTKLDATDGVYTLLVQAPKDSANVTGGPVEVELAVTDTVVAYRYAGNATFPTEFKPFANYSFSPSNITAVAGTAVVPYSYKVYKDGGEATSYDEPGKYLLELTTEFTENSEKTSNYAGHEVIEFTVLGQTTDWSEAVPYCSVDGKEIPAAGVEYTGSAIVPAVSVLYKGEALAAGTDYTVSYRDADGDAVESIVEPGDYEIVVTLNDSQKHEKTQALKVVKALIESAQASAEFFAEGTEPTFIGSTDADFDKGQKFDLAAADVDVEYYEAERVDLNATPTPYDSSDDSWVKKPGAKALGTADLKAGDYVADIKVKATCATLQGGVDVYTAAEYKAAAKDYQNVHVQVLETAGYNDVAADAWYADAVYKAARNNYMSGVAYGVFAPEQAMTRAEFAVLVANMAGVPGMNAGETYPTQFSDVPADAWFAKAVEWAARYGVVSGTSETAFDPYGTVTREQVASILYRYAGAGASADASALAKFPDASSVSPWAQTAMAWAVENGYVSGKGDGTLDPQGTATRAEIASIAVRVQPEAL